MFNCSYVDKTVFCIFLLSLSFHMYVLCSISKIVPINVCGFVLADKVHRQEVVSLSDKIHQQGVCSDITQLGYILHNHPDISTN